MNHTEFARLKEVVSEVLPTAMDLRHRLHHEPEIGGEEHATRQKLLAALDETALQFREPLLETDLIGDLAGESERTICLRADIDALPIFEETGQPHESAFPGMMHACGHDGHSAILAGAALVLSRLQDELPVSVRFVFQPGEEIVCLGRDLVASGACDRTEAAFAMHGWPGLPVGVVCGRPGAFFAAADFFRLRLHGRGGHAALPEYAASPIPAAARVILDFEALHHELTQQQPTVVTVAAVNSGQASNVIPETAEIEGTTRYLEAGRGELVRRRMAAIVENTVAGTELHADFEYEEKYSMPVVNTPESVAFVKELVQTWLPEGAWRDAKEPTMGAEDFAFFLRDRPGAMFRLGLGEDWPSLHRPDFDFNDAAIEAGILTFCLIALEYGK